MSSEVEKAKREEIEA